MVTPPGVFNDTVLADDNSDFPPAAACLSAPSTMLVQHALQCIEAHGSIVSRERGEQHKGTECVCSTAADFHSNRFLRLMLCRPTLESTVNAANVARFTINVLHIPLYCVTL